MNKPRKEVREFVEEFVQTTAPVSALEQLRLKRGIVAKEGNAAIREINREMNAKLKEIDSAINLVEANDPEGVLAIAQAALSV
jgi:Mg2+/Co2+ transporter CorB